MVIDDTTQQHRVSIVEALRQLDKNYTGRYSEVEQVILKACQEANIPAYLVHMEDWAWQLYLEKGVAI